jgi:tetratricopeptide (TPR) repeat protein
MPYDLFISYSRRDDEHGRITQLVKRIEQDFSSFARRELVTFFDKQEIVGMHDWRHRILQGLRESRLLLACLSPSYLQSEYCEWEFVEYQKREISHSHGFGGVAPIYFVHVPGWDDKDFDQNCAAWVAELRRRQHFDLRPWHEQGEAALQETTVADRMQRLNRQLTEAIARGERAEQSLGNVDAHNRHFVGRTPTLRQLRDNFVRPGHIGVVTTVNGVGGLGKTALVVEYAHAFADEYGGGRWQVRCAGKEDLRLALAELATPLGVEFNDHEKKNSDLQFERIRGQLKKLTDAQAPHRCLLILDNVEQPGLLDPAQVARLNSGDWLHVLATTRLGENELHGSHRDRSFLAVDELLPDDALALIESYQRGGHFPSEAEREASREIARLLGCFTLAVESAAVYLGQFANSVTCAAFLARLKKEGLTGLDTAAGQSSQGVLHGEKRLSATLEPTLEKLSDAEKRAMGFAALLPPEQVPLPWLRSLVAGKSPEMGRDAEPGYPDPWKNLLRSLFGLRLLQATDSMDGDGQPRVVRLHRLVQELIRRGAGEEASHWHDALVTRATARSEVLNTHWHERSHQWEISPLVAFANQLLDRADKDAPKLVESISGWLWYYDHSTAPELLLRRSLSQQEADVHTNPCEIAITLSNLGVILIYQARFAEAEPMMRVALAIGEKHRGPDHFFVAKRLDTLASLLRDTNRFAEAEPLYRRSLTINEKSLGPEHPSVAVGLHNLGQLLQATNRRAEAEPMYRRALAIWEKSLGADHPRVATCLTSLARLLQAANRMSEAEPLYRRALSITEKSLGPDHPDVAAILGNLGQLLQVTNRTVEAEPIFRRALAVFEQSLGSDHAHVGTCLNELAQLLKAKSRIAEAEPLMRRAFSIFRASLGVQHRHSQTVLGNYSALLLAMGRSQEEIDATLRQLAPELFESGTTPPVPTAAS